MHASRDKCSGCLWSAQLSGYLSHTHAGKTHGPTVDMRLVRDQLTPNIYTTRIRNSQRLHVPTILNNSGLMKPAMFVSETSLPDTSCFPTSTISCPSAVPTARHTRTLSLRLWRIHEFIEVCNRGRHSRSNSPIGCGNHKLLAVSCTRGIRSQHNTGLLLRLLLLLLLLLCLLSSLLQGGAELLHNARVNVR